MSFSRLEDFKDLLSTGHPSRSVPPSPISLPLAGDLIPSSAVLVFDIHVVDFHNPEDPVQVSVTHKPAECGDASEADDFIEYRYNCSLMDGTLLYSS